MAIRAIKQRLTKKSNNIRQEIIPKLKQGDIVEIGIDVIKFGKTSLTLKCEARNKMTRETILTVDNIIMVNLDNDGKPTPHHKTQIEFVKDRLK